MIMVASIGHGLGIASIRVQTTTHNGVLTGAIIGSTPRAVAEDEANVHGELLGFQLTLMSFLFATTSF